GRNPARRRAILLHASGGKAARQARHLDRAGLIEPDIPRGTMTTATAARRVNILGVGLTPLRMDDALATIDGWIAARDPHYVCVADVHAVMESRWDASLRRIHNRADFVTTDGMPLVWLCRLSGAPHAERIYGPDLMLALCGHSL